MVDEMTNSALIDYVKSNEDSSETERELAYRLESAVAELDTLACEIRKVQAELALELTDRGPDGEDT